MSENAPYRSEKPNNQALLTIFLGLVMSCGFAGKGFGQQERELPKTASALELDEVEWEKRVKRRPREVIDQLLGNYGKKFRGSYVEGLAVMVRLREKGMESIAPVVSLQLEKPAPLRGGSQIAGRLIFAEMALRHGHSEAKDLTLEAADLAFSPADGTALEAMPFHNEMSDAIFMAGPLLARAGVLSGEKKYFDQSIRQIRFIQKLCLREDGLYRHSPLHEAAWGRGNGFPALGIAMILEDLPDDHEGYVFAKGSLTKHLRALRRHQDSDGMWHQVIDHPESYPEFTCTCMISYAILTGLRRGWLEESEWKSVIEKSWRAICGRIDLQGRNVIGACTGTGKQTSLEAYLKRKEIRGYDDRAGSMALLFAFEMKRREE